MALMSFKNLTIGVYEDALFYKIDNILNKITGLLVHKNKRDCILKSALFDGDLNSYSTNQSFLYLAKNNNVDIPFSPLGFNEGYDKEYMENTKVTAIDQHRLGQFLYRPTKNQQTDLSSFLIDNINLLLIITIGYCIICLFNFFLIKLTNCSKIQFFNLLYSNDQLKFLSFKLLNLFFNLFLLINLTLLTNTIKTDKVIIKTDHFLNTDHKLLRTDKKFVFLMRDKDKYRLSPATKKSDKEEEIEMNLLAKKLTSFFFISDLPTVLYFLKNFSLSSKGEEFIYVNDRNYFEFTETFYLRKSLNEDLKKKIHWSTNQYFENGIYLEFELNFVNEMYKLIENTKVPIITNIDQYIDEQSITSSFELENFRTIFNFYFLILFIIWFCLFIVQLIFIINSIYK